MREIDQPQTTDEGVDRSRWRAAAMRAPLATFLALALLVGTAAAGPFSQLVVFGDSLSDVGNVAQATNAFYPFAPRTPGQYYYNGRFSNGSVHVEALAAGLDLPLVHSRSGGRNYAHGGAKMTGTTGLQSLVVRDIDDQVNDYLQSLQSAPADPDALFVMFAGANDVLDTQIMDLTTSANKLRAEIDRLVVAGARHFMVLNQPLMGETPRFNTTGSRGAYNERSTQFNNALSLTLDNLDDNPALTIVRFDVAAIFNQALASPQSFGLTNATQSAAPGLQPGATSYNTSQIEANAHQYLFWDDLHPTATVHAILAQRALTELARGDFNWDGVVDAADYVVWRKRQGATYPISDYAAWRQYFGESGGGGGFAAGSSLRPIVPEPASVSLLLFAAITISVSRRNTRRLR